LLNRIWLGAEPVSVAVGRINTSRLLVAAASLLMITEPVGAVLSWVIESF
jgi:hypothetical protein